jgi:hypothetical protein
MFFLNIRSPLRYALFHFQNKEFLDFGVHLPHSQIQKPCQECGPSPEKCAEMKISGREQVSTQLININESYYTTS